MYATTKSEEMAEKIKGKLQKHASCKSDRYPTPNLELSPLFHRRTQCTLPNQIGRSGDNARVNPTTAPLRQTPTSSPELNALLIMAIGHLPKLASTHPLISSGEGESPCGRTLRIEILTWTVRTSEPNTRNDQAERNYMRTQKVSNKKPFT